MRQRINQIGLALAATFGLIVLVAVPVSAMSGKPLSTDPTTPPTNGTHPPYEGMSDSGSNSKSGSSTTTPRNADSVSDSEKVHTEAQQMVQTKRTNLKEKSTELRQKACQLHEKEVDSRTKGFGASAQKHLDLYNEIFTKVQAYQTKKHLTVPTYDALVAAAQAKQSAATTAVATLKLLDVNIDCTTTDPASTVATVKTAASNARTALKDYRTAIKNIITALKAAQPTTTGGTQ